MSFIADLHIHSRYSRATSRALSVSTLAGWAACKGIGVLGSGDFTHPAWRRELEENLVFDEASGLYRVRGAFELPAGIARDFAGNSAPLFCLQTEISSIYKRGGKTRKIHNLVFMPDLEAVERLCKRLALVGNLNSDGRPILGLDSRDLLEIVLEASVKAVMIPAHIWTPWFSLFGSRSGFDSLEECYGDLSPHIFALETGLSSDPGMNRLLSALDSYVLVSNSDAHSGANLGREANMFAGQPSYAGIFAALRAQAKREPQDDLSCKFLGTMEFYPEEGKYHLDGHRTCNVCLEPGQSRALGNICPVCGKPLTIGVLNRVMELADRASVPALEQEPEAKMLIPLAEVLSEIYEIGSASKKVQECYSRLLEKLGPELDILCKIPVEDISASWEPLGEAIGRMRAGRVIRNSGFDGQFGRIRVFSEDDLRQIRFGKSALLPGLPQKRIKKSAEKPAQNIQLKSPEDSNVQKAAGINWSAEQLRAMESFEAPVFVAAGPGAGKTRVLIGRISRLLDQGVAPQKILAITFTRRAAGEMRDRLRVGSAGKQELPVCDTLHALALALRAEAENLPAFALLPEESAKNLFAGANSGLDRKSVARLWDEIIIAAENCRPLTDEAQKAFAKYEAAKKTGRDFEYLDYNDLLHWLFLNIDNFRGRFQHLLVDEIQDFSTLQLEIVKRLLPENGVGFFGIGDPDQAIYGFRGAIGQSRGSLEKFWPNLQVFQLGKSFRSGQRILDLAQRVLADQGQCGDLSAAFSMPANLHLFSANDSESEAGWIAQKISFLLGATSHTLLDESDKPETALAPSDMAILVRLKAQIPLLEKTLEHAGIPCQVPSVEEFWNDEACAEFFDLVGKNLELVPDFDRLYNFQPFKNDTGPGEILACLARNKITLPAIGDWNLFGKSRAFGSLCRLWKKCGGWQKFYAELQWLNEAELIEDRAEKVRILTLHASKGLEFEAVFLPGLEDGLLPLRPEMIFAGKYETRPADLAEERRLLYVGLTRAAKFVYFSHSASRKLFGKDFMLHPSPFLDNMRDLMRQSRLMRHIVARHESLSLLAGGLKLSNKHKK